MHRAPAVNFSVKRSRWHGRLIVGISLLAWVVLGAFAWGQTQLDVRMSVLAMTSVAATGIAAIGWKKSPQGSLRWDGLHWYWSGFAASPAGRLRLLMDFQNIVLVSVMADTQAPVYLWLEAIPGDASWKPLRRAIVSSQAISGDERQEPERAPEGASA